MVATIVLSYLYALGFFMGALLLFGPEYDQGSLVVLYSKLRGMESDVSDTKDDVDKGVEKIADSKELEQGESTKSHRMKLPNISSWLRNYLSSSQSKEGFNALEDNAEEDDNAVELTRQDKI